MNVLGRIMRRAQPLDWQIATVTAITRETPTVKTLTFALPDWRPHQAGQHYDLRLTAADGYQAQRSYSIASAPEQRETIDLTVERLEDGEVSTYLHDVVVVGDQLEMRGPIGGYFVWDAAVGGPLLLVAGGSGVVPLMAMLRHRAAAGVSVPTRLLFSTREPQEAIYGDELAALQSAGTGLEVFYTFTRSQPPGWSGYVRRIDKQMLGEVLAPLGPATQAYICGPTLLVEVAADALAQLGLEAEHIRTERFGPTGGSGLGG
jgi:ferredoxin-NADP reductase